MNLTNILHVYFKELRDSLRDRRTLLSMIIIPTLLMPGIFALVAFVSFKVVKKAKEEVPTVAILGGADSPAVLEALRKNPKLRVIDAPADWKKRISGKSLRAAVEIPEGFDAAVAAGRAATVRLFHYEGEIKSGFALSELRRFFNERRDQTIVARLQERGLPESLTRPFELKAENVAPPERVGGNIIGGFLPYIFILLCFTGAMYPAMDLTAGEKERGTMETILCSPIARVDLVLGKFLMVLTASLATVAFSLLSMTLTFMAGGTLLAKFGGGAASQAAAAASAGARAAGPSLPSLDPAGVLGVVAMVLPIAVMFAAGLLAVSLFAKSYKEAQSYVSPFIIVIIVPAMMGMLPGVELNAKLALVPILNLSLVSKEMVSGIFNWHYIALIFGSSCVYAAIALAWCVRMFNREDVIFRS
jgi:sodium transport system permease protein